MAASLIGIAISLAAGIYFSPKFSVYFLLLFFTVFLLVWLIHGIMTKRLNLAFIIFTAVFISGALWCKYQGDPQRHILSRYTDHFVTLTGRICEIPVQDGDITQYTVDVRRLLCGNAERKIRETVHITSSEKFQYGETVNFSGFPDTFPERLNESGFDLAKYYKSKNIFFRMTAEEARLSSEKIRSYSVYSISTGIKCIISQFIEKYNTGDKAAVLKAVLTGNKKEISEELYDIMLRTDTSKSLYPAFLHIMMLVTFVGLFSRIVPKKYRDIALIVFLILFALANCARPSFLRSAVMMAFIVFWKLKFGYANFLDMFSVTFIIIAVLNPLILYNYGFIISLAGTLLIHYFYKASYDYFKNIPFKFIRKSLSIGLILTIGLIPLNARFFGGESLYGFISRVLMIPPVLGIMLSFPVVFVLKSLFGTSFLFGGFMTAMTYWILYVPRFMDKLISSYIMLPRPSIIFIAAWILAIATFGFYVYNRRKSFRITFFLSLALFSSVFANQLLRIGNMEITFVNVGQGDGAIVDVPYRGAVIIDGGGSGTYTDYNIGKKIFVPYLQSAGIMRIDAAFVSHYHKDHAEGVIAAIENLRVKNVFMPDVMPDSEYRQAIEKAAAEHNTKIYYVSENSRVVFKNGLIVNITVPTQKTKNISSDENDTSLLYEVCYGDFNAYFTGDMTKFAERNLIEQNAVHDCDLLKVAHHGSQTSTSQEWVDAVTPEVAVVSVGEDNMYGLPNDEVLERFKNIRLLRTDENGDIKITVNKHGIKKIESYR